MWTILNNNSGAVIALSTAAYCILTALLGFAALRANRLTVKLIKLQNKPQLAIRLHRTQHTTMVLKNCSSNQAHSVEIRVGDKLLPKLNVWPDEDMEIPLADIFKVGENVTIEISFEAPTGEKYKEKRDLIVD